MLTLIARDVYLLYGAWVLERHGRRLPVTMLGKVTTAVLMAGFASLIWNYPMVDAPVLFTWEFLGSPHIVGGARQLGSYIAYAGVVLSLTSAVQYTVAARAAYREAVASEAAS
jgi:cardiolipin synthase